MASLSDQTVTRILLIIRSLWTDNWTWVRFCVCIQRKMSNSCLCAQCITPQEREASFPKDLVLRFTDCAKAAVWTKLLPDITEYVWEKHELTMENVPTFTLLYTQKSIKGENDHAVNSDQCLSNSGGIYYILFFFPPLHWFSVVQ